MKLRLEKGTVKLRLSPQELERLNLEKELSEQIYFSHQNRFNYKIEISDSVDFCTANFEPEGLIIRIPLLKAEKWMNSNQIGIKETIVTDKGDEIVLTLEEDLPPRKHKKQ